MFQFRQMMQNLVGNALKFSDPAKSPHITVKSHVANGSELNNGTLLPEERYRHITVEDNGIGFDPIYSEKIFDVFQCLHRKEQYNGTGLAWLS